MYVGLLIYAELEFGLIRGSTVRVPGFGLIERESLEWEDMEN